MPHTETMATRAAGVPPAHDRLLLLRFLLVNAVALSLAGAAWLQGWLDALMTGYTAWLSAVIAGVFLTGLALCAVKVTRVSRDLDALRSTAPDAGSAPGRYLAGAAGRSGVGRAIGAEAFGIGLASDISGVRHFASSLLLLGLIGTVIGFIVGLSGVDPALATDVDQIAPTVATLIDGMSIALYTTLLGAVLHVWLAIGHRLLATGAMHLLKATVEAGERRVGD